MFHFLSSKKLIFYTIIILLVIGGFYLYNFKSPTDKKNPDPQMINVLGKEKVKYPQDYTIVMVGDSMTEGLGNSDEIKKFLSDYYPGKTLEVLNYGFGSTNILSVMGRITNETQHGRAFRPITEIDYDLILLESFGQNPLSEYPLEEGLKKQTEELDKIVKVLKETNPEGKIVFLAAISPNKNLFAKNQVDLSAEERIRWVNERIAYIKNHIKYAKEKNIPIINVFDKSLMDNGDGNPEFISSDDYIHLSPKGIILTSKTIADFVYNNKIFPVPEP